MSIRDASFPEPETPPPGAGNGEAPTGNANIVYILYLVGLFVWLVPVVGVIVAYVHKDDAPPWLKSHYDFQIRTFWYGLLMTVAGSLLTLVMIGYAILLFAIVWWIVRCVKGMKALSRRDGIA